MLNEGFQKLWLWLALYGDSLIGMKVYSRDGHVVVWNPDEHKEYIDGHFWIRVRDDRKQTTYYFDGTAPVFFRGLPSPPSQALLVWGWLRNQWKKKSQP